MTTESQTDLFHSSLKRCQDAPLFFERFYALFLGKKDAIRVKFERVNMERQMRMLQASMQMVMLASQPGIDPGFYLSQMAGRHSRKDLDIPPQLYAYWLEALLQTVEEKDPKYTAEVREVWNLIMESGIQYMCSRYED